ncbi:S41 family peptidase [Pedobacter sp. UYP30]|uniref:S41 family peptidase n=1 Tax=Pedobacter sp. UYP30 TaxID=1756400 RepID=UPI0033993D86
MKKLLLAFANIFSQFAHAQKQTQLDLEKVDQKTGNPIGWKLSFYPGQEKSYKIQLDSTVKQQGKLSISMEKIANDSNYGAIDFPINEAFEGKEITLKGFVKIENVNSGYAGLWMRFDDAQGKARAFENMNKNGLKGTKSWQPISITLPYDGNFATSLHFGGILVGDGKVWFDNLKVFIDGNPIEKARVKIFPKAVTDTSFASSSGIKVIDLSEQQIKNLTIAGEFWAFLKYYHQSVAAGEYNWDAELFRLLPQVIKSKDNKMLSSALEIFLDRLPKPKVCIDCAKLSLAKQEIKPNYGFLLDGKVLGTSLTKKLNYVKDNRNTKTNYYVSLLRIGNPDFTVEKPYWNMSYPDAGYRILSLYRYWAMINYFYPYRDVIGEDWNKVLSSSLPDFINAKNDLDYSLATLKIISRVKDTHANIWGYNKAMDDYKGKYAAPFQARFIENKLVILALHTDTLDVRKVLVLGDVISKIDGILVKDLVKKYLPIAAASNYDTQLRVLSTDFLLRSNQSKLKLTIQRGSKIFDYDVPMGSIWLAYKDELRDKSVAYKVFDNNIALVYPGKYKNSMLPEIKEDFKKAKGMIIDMRCYPSDFMPYKFGAYLKEQLTPFAKFTIGSLSFPGSFRFSNPVENGGSQSELNREIDHFKGNVVVIVNSTTQSQAEFTTMAFQSSPKVRVTGSTTAGADGDVSQIILPGGIYTMISGIGVYYPNGTPTQRVGVKIDYPIYPTIKGVAAGKDELMEKAIEILKKGF